MWLIANSTCFTDSGSHFLVTLLRPLAFPGRAQWLSRDDVIKRVSVLGCETVNVYVLYGLRGLIHLPVSLSALDVCTQHRQVVVKGGKINRNFDVMYWVRSFAVVLKTPCRLLGAKTTSWLLEYLSTSYYLCSLGRSTVDLRFKVATEIYNKYTFLTTAIKELYRVCKGIILGNHYCLAGERGKGRGLVGSLLFWTPVIERI